MNKKKGILLGPAVLVTAAFIGPGTVMTASKAGSEFGYLLLWAVVFSVVATIVLQEMAARMGIVTGDGLSQALKTCLSSPLVRICVLGLVLVAILAGNAAYQTGNILGAASGAQALVTRGNEATSNQIDEVGGEMIVDAWLDARSRSFQNGLVALIAIIVLSVIWIGRFDFLQKLLSLLVALMSLLFIFAAVQSGPDWSRITSGFVPRIPTGGEWIVIGIIGTTVVPYNLFLHASAAAQQWKVDPSQPDSNDLFRFAIRNSRWDTILSVSLGGLVTCAILVTAAVAFHRVDSVDDTVLIHGKQLAAYDVAVQLEPALGRGAKLVFAIGLFAAGLTSAITAPVAAGFAVSGCFGWTGKLEDWRLKLTASGVVLAGVFFAIVSGESPQETIILAQVANGLLLPIIAVLLLMIVNQKELLGQYRNGKLTNALGMFVILIATLIAARQLYSVGQQVYKKIQPLGMQARIPETDLIGRADYKAVHQASTGREESLDRRK